MKVSILFGLLVAAALASGCARQTELVAKTPAEPAQFSASEIALIQSAIEEGADDLSLIAVTRPGESKTVTKKVLAAGGKITYDASEPETAYEGGFLVLTVRPAQAVALVKSLKLRAVAVDRKFSIDFEAIKNHPEEPGLRNKVASGAKRVARGEANPYLPVHETGALDFRRAANTDGSGTTIAVVDTGVALGHEAFQDRIIDWKDTTGEGDVVLHNASVTRASEKTLVESALGKIDVSAVAEGAENFRVGFFNEELKIQGGDIEGDLNRNHATDDKLAVIAFQKTNSKGEKQWFGAIDNDLDLVIRTDEVAGDFLKTRQALKFGQGANRGVVQAALDIANDGSKLTIGFDGGAHGTHVAGIAAGRGLMAGRMDGAAPGAKIMAVKVLQSRGFGTDSMVLRGVIYAATHGADVINMSLGDRELKGGEDPWAVVIRDVSERYGTIFSISAGNSGPAITTVGSPGASGGAITSGAYVSAETYAANYGARSLSNGLFFFSSVGPTVVGGLKPTIVSPGSAVSSVPNYMGGYAMFNGTSMSAPQTSGSLALLVAKAKQDNLVLVADRAKRKFLPAAIKKALAMSAKDVSGYSPLELGYGLIDTVGAYEVLKRINEVVASGKAVFEYDITASSQLTSNGKGAGAYLRNSFNAESETFELKRLLPHGMTDADGSEQSDFAFELRSTGTYRDSAKHLSSHVTDTQALGFGMTGTTSLAYNVKFDRTALTQPGAYSTRLDAYNHDTGLLETSLLTTAVRPHQFTAESERPYSFYTRNVRLEGGRIHRYFFSVPANATGLSVKLHIPEGQTGRVRANINDPAGTLYVKRSAFATRKSDEDFDDANVTVNRLSPGVWEVDVYAAFAEPVSVYSLRVSLSALSVQPQQLALPRSGGSVTFLARNDLGTGAASFKAADQGFVYRDRKSIQLGYREYRALEITKQMLAPGAKTVPVTVLLTNPKAKEDILSAEFTDEQKRPFVQLGLSFDQTFLGQLHVLKAALKPGRYFVAISGDFIPSGESTYDYEERISTPIGQVAVTQAGEQGLFDQYQVTVEPKATAPQGYGFYALLEAIDKATRQAQAIVPVYLQAQ